MIVAAWLNTQRYGGSAGKFYLGQNGTKGQNYVYSR